MGASRIYSRDLILKLIERHKETPFVVACLLQYPMPPRHAHKNTSLRSLHRHRFVAQFKTISFSVLLLVFCYRLGTPPTSEFEAWSPQLPNSLRWEDRLVPESLSRGDPKPDVRPSVEAGKTSVTLVQDVEHHPKTEGRSGIKPNNENQEDERNRLDVDLRPEELQGKHSNSNDEPKEEEPKPEDDPGSEDGQKPDGESDPKGDSKSDGAEEEPRPEQQEDESEECDGWTDLEAPVADWDYFPDIKEQSVREPSLKLDPDKCSKLKLKISPPKRRPPSKGACDGYEGILHIQEGDFGGASGTIFFQYMIGHLQWAAQHNYKPWVHLNNVSKPVFDTVVHTQGPGVKFTMMDGMEVDSARDKRDPCGYLFPGRPKLRSDTVMASNEFAFKGTGVWGHYFEPVSDFSPGDPSCSEKPMITLDSDQVAPGLHAQAPWSPKAWRYWMPDYIQQTNISLQDWFEPQRRHAAAIAKRHIRFNAGMEQRAACAHPNSENSLGMHIRHGDKWLSRDILSVNEFLPYCEAFVDNGGGAIYLATDSSMVFDEIKRDWPDRVTSRIVRQQAVKGLSRNGTAAFELGVSTHRTNVEALTDGLALSKCTYLLHGLSALSEAAFYMNPGLIERAVNLETEEDPRLEVDYFVNQILPRGRA